MGSVDLDSDGRMGERSRAGSVLSPRNAESPSARAGAQKSVTSIPKPAPTTGPLARLAQLQARHAALLDGIQSAQRSAERVRSSLTGQMYMAVLYNAERVRHIRG